MHASDVLMNDLHHAGYYGEFFRVPATAAPPDPCAVVNDAGQITSSLPYAVQGYDAPDFDSLPDLSGTSCGAWLADANLQPGSDVLVVRRTETVTLPVGEVAPVNAVYLQSNPFSAEIQFGSGAGITAASRADGTPAVVMKRDGVTAADIRRFVVHVYFVAPCSVPSDGSDICTGPDDDDDRPIPTLKRLELSSNPAGTTMQIQTVSEGIESLQVDYGIDSLPVAKNLMTGYIGDGSPDAYVRNPPPLDFASAVTARVHLLARNTEPTVGHVDAKTYRLGLSGEFNPADDSFKRHVYTGTVRMTNTSGRREIPQ